MEVGAGDRLAGAGVPRGERHPAQLRALLAGSRGRLLLAAADHLERALLRERRPLEPLTRFYPVQQLQSVLTADR